ncbi:MAG: penicillin-insensitive murein endopeptidase [Deltaproteobacteria bacterium]|nr:penicillin-insensitive murein endopeptidase [Deltaproteobacteria bacterium]
MRHGAPPRNAGSLRLLAVALCLSVTALADPRRPSTSLRAGRRAVGGALAPSASQGFPNHGSLVHGRRLEEGPTVRYLPGRTLHWGTEELVGLLERAARTLHQRYRVRLTVGDLSARNGGPVARHRSHQSGRDADLAFFARDRRGQPVTPQDYAVFTATGRTADGRLEFDTARNWAMVEALLSDRQVRPERIFVSGALRGRLLAYGRAHASRGSLVTLASSVLAQPARVSPHDNHFHVRIPCPSGDAACRWGVQLPRRLLHPRRLLRPAHRHPRRR